MYRQVIFAPEVPIRLDYRGKRVDMTHGPLAGLLMGLAQLNCSEIRLKQIYHRHGYVFPFSSHQTWSDRFKPIWITLLHTEFSDLIAWLHSLSTSGGQIFVSLSYPLEV